MPYSTVDGFPPLPTQRACGTIYEPKSTLPSATSRGMSAHSVLAGAPPAVVPPHRGEAVGAEGETALHDAPPPLPLVPTTRSASPPTESDRCYLPRRDLSSVWLSPVSLAVVEQRRTKAVDGVAAFRPASFATGRHAQRTSAAPAEESAAAATAAAGHSGKVKGLLQPFVNAQELAHQASEESWHVRRLRYLQWLRKGALTAKKQEEERLAEAEADVDFGPVPGELYTSLSPAPLNGGSTAAIMTPRSALAHTTPLPPLGTSVASRRPSPGTAAVHDLRAFDSSQSSAMVGSRLACCGGGDAGVGMAVLGAEVQLPNPNEVAVRRLFRLAQGTGHSAPPSPTAPSNRREEAGDNLTATVSDGGGHHSALLSSSTKTNGDLGASSSASAVSLLAGREKAEHHSPLLESRAMVERGASLYRPISATGTMWSAEADDDREDSTCASSRSTVEPPAEYAVAALLRERMHHTVATFTASSTHTLDEPPAKHTRKLLGQARLRSPDGAPATLRPVPPPSLHAEQSPLWRNLKEQRNHQKKKAEEDASSLALVLLPQALSSRVARGLMYEEAYERGLLYQLAFQSSPTRWYSAELPSGGDGLAFRRVYAPVMRDDSGLRRRLDAATTCALISIAQPRHDYLAARQGHVGPRLVEGVGGTLQLVGTNSSDANDDGGGGISTAKGPDAADMVRMALDRAAEEKAAMLKQWTRLHVNLTAQWTLLQAEQSERFRLLGHFASCAYPEPCVCLECDQEVLSMSAVPLEPTIKPLCWYTSVVLRGHHEVLQKALLVEYEAGLAKMYAEFRVLFISTYTRERLVEEEARRFRTMLHYHQFCLRVASRDPSLHASLATMPVQSGSLETSQALHEEEVALLTGTKPAMWRFRHRRLQAYRAFDSPFFSYLVYVEMITVQSAEEQVRAQLMEQERESWRDLLVLRGRDEQISAFFTIEHRRRSWIEAEMMEAYSWMLTGPLVQLHARHMAEMRECEAAAYAKVCAAAQQSLMAAALDAKQVEAGVAYGRYKALLRETRQSVLTLLVDDRSAAASVATSKRWLEEQQRSVVAGAEQRLRDRMVMIEEAEAFADLMCVAAASKRSAQARERKRVAAAKVEREAAEAAAAREVARARAEAEEAELARLERANISRHPELRPSSKLPKDKPNQFVRFATALDEDYAYFLSTLD